ncbi:Imm10 family immunity protein [Streptomyces sp. NPDC002055]|uniref:Imm10 family immunity protein n=1 Tax=Streptomyces sp. NPDC002055 TaxID=3154534 RepID=UPI00331E7348
MRITARAAGAVEDEEDEVLEAGFSEGADGSGVALLFQRDLFADTPWDGDPETTDLFSNSYCVTLGTGQTCYGGIEEITFEGNSATFTFSPRTAETLGLGARLAVHFDIAADDLEDFKATLPRIITWGTPTQVPQLTGI